MSHLGQEALRRILAGEGGVHEAEAAAEHLLSCDRCRALAGSVLTERRLASRQLQGEGSLRLVYDVIDRERQWGVEALTAIAEWAELRRLPSRRSQRDRVRMSKACQTIAFFDLLLNELKEAPSWDEAEFIASLSLLCIERMVQREQITPATQNDLQAKLWTAVANARRRGAEWARAHQALANAERHLKEGTGDPRLEAGFLSISASTLADEGHATKALDALMRCREIYEALSDWGLLARTLVQMANVLEPIDPARGLVALDHAAPLLPANDSFLALAAEMLRVECLIGVGKPNEALRVFRRSVPLLSAIPRVRPQIRSKFTCACLLDALGLQQHAESLFEEVVERDIEHDLYKDAFLDLLYLYERHLKAGDAEKAVRVCRRALNDAALFGFAHEQMRDLWTQLLDAAERQAISQDVLQELRRYLSIHWKSPATTPPVVGRR